MGLVFDQINYECLYYLTFVRRDCRKRHSYRLLLSRWEESRSFSNVDFLKDVIFLLLQSPLVAEKNKITHSKCFWLFSSQLLTNNDISFWGTYELLFLKYSWKHINKKGWVSSFDNWRFIGIRFCKSFKSWVNWVKSGEK